MPQAEVLLERKKIDGHNDDRPGLDFKQKPIYDFFKRLFDIVVSTLALILLSPLFLIVSIIIILEDFGNPFYISIRTGFCGKEFKMYKFRSMHKKADDAKEDLRQHNQAGGPLFKIYNDPRVTRFGNFIRKTSIDELPQLVNIIKGDMSIIGPRPLIVNEQNQCDEYQSQRLLVRPGLSCYTALDKKSEEDFDKWIELDLKYIRDRSFKTDIFIIIKTVGVILRHRNY